MFKKFLTGSKNFDDIEPHEILLDSLAKKREQELGISEKKLEVPLLSKILQGFYIVSIFLILILLAKTFQLQIVEGKNFSILAEGIKFIMSQILPAMSQPAPTYPWSALLRPTPAPKPAVVPYP